MNILIQKHRLHPIWKFYGEDKSFLGQIQGSTKEGMSDMAVALIPLLRGGEVASCRKEVLADGSINVYPVSGDKRIANFEKEFEAIALAIENNK